MGFFTFFKLYKWQQITQSVSCLNKNFSPEISFISSRQIYAWFKEGYKVPPFKLGQLKLGPLFSLSILHMIPQNSPNGEMDEGHI